MRGQMARQFADMRPAGGFSMIMADPPWQFTHRSAAGVNVKAAGGQYGLMTLDDIKEMPVEALAADDAVLWLWATNPMLREAMEVLGAWGFCFKTAGHWAMDIAGLVQRKAPLSWPL